MGEPEAVISVEYRNLKLWRSIHVVRTGDKLFNGHTVALIGEVAKRVAEDMNSMESERWPK